MLDDLQKELLMLAEKFREYLRKNPEYIDSKQLILDSTPESFARSIHHRILGAAEDMQRITEFMERAECQK